MPDKVNYTIYFYSGRTFLIKLFFSLIIKLAGGSKWKTNQKNSITKGKEIDKETQKRTQK